MKVAIAFSQFGPYHHSRVQALIDAGFDILPLQVSCVSRTYAWNKNASEVEGLVNLIEGAEEDATFIGVFMAASKIWRLKKIEVAFLPSYFPISSLALLLSAKLAGVSCIMMNESHAGTEKAGGFKKRIKKGLISLFSGAIVGGEPHRRYFVSLGMKDENIVTGYDAIDNTYFTKSASEALANAEEHRRLLGLPDRYLLSLGRMVEKKNLVSLIEAYSEAKKAEPQTSLKLVFVGSGDREAELTARCDALGLKWSKTPAENATGMDVLFFGFRQIDENPIFYALAEAFVLPSLYEEWGLVVNEAMASGLPILVSETVGSAENLVIPGVNGFHFDPKSSYDLAEKILILERNPEKRRSMAKASSERIKHWGCENFAEQAKVILNKVARG